MIGIQNIEDIYVKGVKNDKDARSRKYYRNFKK